MTKLTIEQMKRHAKRITTGNTYPQGVREVLNGIHYVDTSMIATDGHRLYRSQSHQAFQEAVTVNPKTNEVIDHRYPVEIVNNFIDDKDDARVVKLTMDTVKKMKKLLVEMKKWKTSIVDISVDADGNVVFSGTTDKGVYFSEYANGHEQAEPVFKKRINVKYLKDGLDAVSQGAKERVDIYYLEDGRRQSLTPIQFKSETGQSDYLILPIRMG